MIGMVLAAGAGRRLRPDTDALPKTLLPVDGPTTILDIALRNLAAVGLTDVAVIVGHAAEAISDRVPALERDHGVRLELVPQRPGAGLEQRLLAVAGPRVLRPGRAAGQRRHRAPGQRRADAAQGAGPVTRGRLILAVDDVKPLADEEMKVILDERGLLSRITKQIDPARADGEYIGATLIEPLAARGRWPTRWRRPGAGTRPVLRGRLPGAGPARRRDRGRADRRRPLGRGRQPRRPAPRPRHRPRLLTGRDPAAAPVRC